MEHIKGAAEVALSRLLPSEECSLLRPLALPLRDEQGLQRLWTQALARYPNQEFPDWTPDMYLREWERMVLAYGLEAFTQALSKAVSESKFFPDPVELEQRLAARAESRRLAAAAHEHLCRLAEDKAAWESDTDRDAFREQVERINRKLAVLRKETGAGASADTLVVGEASQEGTDAVQGEGERNVV